MLRRSGFLLAALVVLLASVAIPNAGLVFAQNPQSASEPMPPLQYELDSRLRRNLDFWIAIYTQYNTQQGLVHDAKYVDRVYEVIDFSKHPGARHGALIKSAKAKWKKILLSIQDKQSTPEKMDETEKRVFEMYKDIDEPNKFLNGAHRKRLRFQLGQKDSFLQGLADSGRYLPMMEEVFKRNGMPPELTRLPFVESSFNVKARSKVGASGIWQFMRSTGRLFLKINDAVDERNDPIRATEAAAKLLRLNYESLHSWPLAVTAYNHGRKGIMRAVRRVGSEELQDVVMSYRSRSFGFASGNYFTELLAAIEVEKNAEKYFGKIEREPPIRYIEAPLPDYISIRHLKQFLKLDPVALRELNPGLSEEVFRGRLLVPAGYVLRMPYDGKLPKEAMIRVFYGGYEEIPAIYKLKVQRRAKK